MPSSCRICHRSVAFFTCDRCQNDFCEEHINVHEDEPLVSSRDNPNEHPLIKQIDRWEKQSIERIQRRANELRKEIFSHLDEHFKRTENSFQRFDELIKPKTMRLKEEFLEEKTSFISPIALELVERDDIFHRSAGNLRIVDGGERVVHSQWSDHASVRGEKDYFCGEHRLSFAIDALSPDRWAFFGIISKETALKPISIATPTVYGFAGQNGICRNGIYRSENDEIYSNEFQANDILHLTINCAEHRIRLTNERTRRSDQLDVDPTDCPLPWNFLVGLCCAAGDSIRILPSRDEN